MIQLKNVLNSIITNNKIIWAHSGIGKTYLYNQGRSDIIDFDICYKGLIGGALAFPELLLDTNIPKENADKIKAHPKIVVDRLFDLAVEESKTTDKKLLVSDIRLLKERTNDFDRIITIPKDTYIKNTLNRDVLSSNARCIVKDYIDKVIDSIEDRDKIIEVDCYLSEILPMSDEIKILSNKEKQKDLIERFKYLSREILKLKY